MLNLAWKLDILNINPNDLRFLCSPGVYLFWQKPIRDGNLKGEIALYIGSSKRTIARMADRSHEAAQKSLRECTRVEIRFCESEEKARELESMLIQMFKPKYNVHCRKNKSVQFQRA